MLRLMVADVGDGLAVSVHMMNGDDVQIDCGSTGNASRALLRGMSRIQPEVFVLSHFHADHYNGLLCPDARHLPLRFLRQVYFPRLPKFAERPRFLECLAAMALRSLGGRSGSPPADLLNILSRMTSKTFGYRAVAAGDTIRFGPARWDVLWPPRQIDERGDTAAAIRRAIADFDAALEADEDLRRAERQVRERETIAPYLHSEGTRSNEHAPERERWESDHETFEAAWEPRPLPPPVQTANRSLRAAANELSLAFVEDSRLLFLGDLEAAQIAEVANTLVSRDQRNFLAMIAPHHATHWHDILRDLRAQVVVGSLGERLWPKLRHEYNDIAAYFHRTHAHGDYVGRCDMGRP